MSNIDAEKLDRNDQLTPSHLLRRIARSAMDKAKLIRGLLTHWERE